MLVAVALAATAAAAATHEPSAEVSPRAATRDRAGDPPRVEEGVAAVEHWHRVDGVLRFYAELERQRIADEAAAAAAAAAAEKAREEREAKALQRAEQARASRSAGHVRTPSDGSVWDRLAACESGGRWGLDALHDGGLQFNPKTWTAYVAAGKPYALEGFPAYAYQATREQQIAVAVRVRDGVPGSSDPYLNASGWGAWPTCSRKLGLRG